MPDSQHQVTDQNKQDLGEIWFDFLLWEDFQSLTMIKEQCMKEMEILRILSRGAWKRNCSLLSRLSLYICIMITVQLLSCQSPANRGTLWSELYFYLGSSPSPRESTWRRNFQHCTEIRNCWSTDNVAYSLEDDCHLFSVFFKWQPSRMWSAGRRMASMGLVWLRYCIERERELLELQRKRGIEKNFSEKSIYWLIIILINSCVMVILTPLSQSECSGAGGFASGSCAQGMEWNVEKVQTLQLFLNLYLIN